MAAIRAADEPLNYANACALLRKARDELADRDAALTEVIEALAGLHVALEFVHATNTGLVASLDAAEAARDAALAKLAEVYPQGDMEELTAERDDLLERLAAALADRDRLAEALAHTQKLGRLTYDSETEAIINRLLREALRDADDVLCEIGEWANWSPNQRPKVEQAIVLAQNWLSDWERPLATPQAPTEGADDD